MRLILFLGHHWAFDRGWFGISDSYHIIVPSDRIQETPSIGSQTLQDHHDRPILLPTQPQTHPDPQALAWHREYWAIG